MLSGWETVPVYIRPRHTHTYTSARIYIHHTRTQNHCVRSPPTVTRQNHPFDLTCIYSAHIYYIYIYRRQYNRVYCCYVCVCVCVILNNNNTSANTRNLVERLDPLHCVCGGYHRAAHDTIDDYDVYIIWMTTMYCYYAYRYTCIYNYNVRMVLLVASAAVFVKGVAREYV
jgi:hypothetical protein